MCGNSSQGIVIKDADVLILCCIGWFRVAAHTIKGDAMQQFIKNQFATTYSTIGLIAAVITTVQAAYLINVFFFMNRETIESGSEAGLILVLMWPLFLMSLMSASIQLAYLFTRDNSLLMAGAVTAILAALTGFFVSPTHDLVAVLLTVIAFKHRKEQRAAEQAQAALTAN
jgi:chromate transport protein ChrA